MKKIFSLTVTLIVLGLLLVPVLSHGQGFGSIVGTISDNTGSVIVSAKVKVTEVGTNSARTVTTDAQGYYVIPTLRPAQYNLNIEAAGFRTYSQKDITLLADQTLTVNAEMKVGATSETVEVTAAPVQVNVADGTASQVIDRARISNLPLNGRNAAQLTLLVPGAVSIPGVVNPTSASGGGAIQGQTKTYPGAITVSTNGARQNWLSYQLDGGNNIDEYTNVNQPFPFPDALQEFSVQTSNYSAQYGQSAGGVVNIVTRAGGNQFHGDLFEFVRNPVFNAQNFFSTPTVPDVFKRNQFGGTVGGPIIHDKTFFFFGYQGTRIRNVSTFKATVPTQAQLNGDFSSLLSLAKPVQLKCTAGMTGCAGGKFTGNQIPIGDFNTASVNLIKLLPITQADPNTGAVTVARPLNQDFNEYVTRFDHSFTAKDQFTFRHYYAQFNAPAVFQSSDILSWIDQASILSQNFLVNETHVFNPNVLNEFHVSYSRESASRGPAANAINVNDLGSNLTFQPTPKAIQSINVSGFFSFGDNPKGKFVRNNYAFNDNVSWIWGKHTFHFGGVLELSRVDIRNLFNQPGLFTFDNSGSNSGNAMADFMLGWMRQFQQGAGEFKENYNSFPGVYIQDDYHVTRRLTVNLGLRWEALLPWKEKQNRVELFNPAALLIGTKSTVFPNAPAGLFFVGDPGVNAHTGTSGSYNNFAPRVGFAYDLMGDGKTSIRGGAGIFYATRQEGIINNRFVDVTPFSPQTILSTAGGATKPGSFSDPYCAVVGTQTTFGCTSQPVQFPALFPPPSTTPFILPLSLVVSWDPNHKIDAPTVYNWNLALEHEMPWGVLARAAYVGSRSIHIRESLQLNPTVPITGTPATFSQYTANQVWMAGFDVNSSYNSLQLSAEKRASKNLTILANYTYSKSIDDLPVGAGVADIGSDSPSALPFGYPNRHAFDRGPSDFDHTHRFVTSYLWQLPELSGQNFLVHTFLGGWQFNGVMAYQTGRPFTVLAGTNISKTGLPTQRAIQSGPAFGPGACATKGLSQCLDLLNITSFANTLPVGQFNSFGNVAKGQFRWPGAFTWDAGLVKTFQVSERVGIQFRAEYFNVLNHPVWSSDDTSVNATATVSNANFGTIRVADDPRIGQLAIKIIF